MVRTPSPRSPRNARRRLIAACLAVLVASAPIVLPSAFADDLKHKQHAAKHHIRAVKGDLDESSHALRAAAARLQAARGKLAAAQRTLNGTRVQLRAAAVRDKQMAAQLVRAQQALVKARGDVEQSKADVREQRRQIGMMAAHNYQYGNPQLMGLVAVFNSHSTPADLTSQLNTAHSLMDRQATTLETLRATEAKLAAQEVKVAEAKDAVAAQRRTAAANLVAKKKLEAVAEGERQQVARFVASRRAAEHAAARVRAHDLAELRQAKKQERRIQRLIRERSRRQHGGYRGSTNGFLFRPVPGWVTSPYGWRIHPIYHYWGLHDGTDFHAPCGTPERAAESGTVISEYYSSVWGNRLYLDLGRVNGKNMTVIYNHLSRYRVGTGAHVRRGEIIGYAGTTGWSTGCHLHFTVMVNGNPVNPMKFM